jgi:site-specific DNA-methyltransferase (adenine-specific)
MYKQKEEITITNHLYFGDNLEVMKEFLKDESIDLIYLDPPFNSKKDYNVLFKDENEKKSTAQIKAFSDTWHWTELTEETFVHIIETADPKITNTISSLVNLLGRNQVTAYLVMMTVRLIEMYRVLKPIGSLYLHCDSTSSHYIKVILDAVFDVKNFRNEIIWHYRRWTGKSKNFLKMHDTIFYYTKTNNYTFNPQFTDYTEKSKRRKKYYHTRIKGDDIYETDINEHGVLENDVWLIPIINSQAKERLGYPTQKPVELIKKILLTSSNDGDVVLDPFCGCGTTIEAAQLLDRKWIGIDVTNIAFTLIKYRLNKIFGDVTFTVHGIPYTVDEAKSLALTDRMDFQIWACGLIKAKPFKKKGADGGIDGVIDFVDGNKHKKIVISVKSGKVEVKDIRELSSLIDDYNFVMGFLITLEKPTQPMIKEAISKGFFKSYNNIPYQKVQIRTIEQLLSGELFKKPLS